MNDRAEAEASLFDPDYFEALVATRETGDPALDADRLLAKRIAWHRADVKARQVVAEETGEPATVTALRQDAVADLRGRLLDREALRNIEPKRYLIKGVLDFDSESWLIGASGGFKSFMAIDWACHVALGLDWWGRRIRPGKVLYIVGEGVRGINQRVTAWEIANRRTVTNLIVHPGPIQVRAAGERDAISFNWHTLCQFVSEDQPVLIVLDTQARMTVGLEENSNTSMGVWIEGVRLLRVACGACVLVVHHTGRAGLDARGASALDAAQDVEWKVTRVGDKARLAARLSCEKNKDGNDNQAFDFQGHVVELGTDEDGDPVTSLALRPMSAEMAQHVAEEALVEGFAYDADRNLTPNQAEVLSVLREVVGWRGETQAGVLRMVNERRKERAAKTGVEAKAMPRTSLTRALEALEEEELAVAIGATGSRWVDAAKAPDGGSGGSVEESAPLAGAA